MTDETKRIGDYQILDELGSGGMGRVWRVRNVITDRIEAMKVLLPDLAGRQELAARFQREIKLMASLNHPNIADLRTAFTADNQLYMVMEYVEGTTVADKLPSTQIIQAFAESQNGNAGYYVAVAGTALNNWKLKAFSGGGTEISAGAYPASVTTDVVQLAITARKLL